MQKWLPEFEQADLRIVVLTTDSPPKNLRIVQQLKLSIPILSDPDGRVLRKIGMWDSRWKIASYGYYLLGPDLSVISHFKGRWRTTENAKQFFLAKIGRKEKKAS